MKQIPKTELFSLFSVILGLVGLALQSWLFSTADADGLLIHGHIAGILCLMLLGVVFLINHFGLKDVRPDGEQERLFPKSIFSAVGCFVAALGFLLSSLTIAAEGALLLVIYVFGILSGFAIAYAGFCRLQGQSAHSLLFVVVAVYLVFRTLAACQVWSAEVQVQHYVFPLLANLSLLITAYYRAAIHANMGNCRRYLLFRNVALFCCLLGAMDGDWVFYLSGALWTAVDFCAPVHYGKYAV